MMQDKDERIHALLEKMNTRVTTQRKDVLQVFLENSHQHLSAVDIYNILNERNKAMGIATIYRTLGLFEDRGIIIKRDFGNETAKYEFVPSEVERHHHLICKNCGRVIEIADMLPADFKERLLREKGFQTDYCSLKVYGYCKDCREKAKPAEKTETT